MWVSREQRPDEASRGRVAAGRGETRREKKQLKRTTLCASKMEHRGLRGTDAGAYAAPVAAAAAASSPAAFVRPSPPHLPPPSVHRAEAALRRAEAVLTSAAAYGNPRSAGRSKYDRQLCVSCTFSLSPSTRLPSIQSGVNEPHTTRGGCSTSHLYPLCLPRSPPRNRAPLISSCLKTPDTLRMP